MKNIRNMLVVLVAMAALTNPLSAFEGLSFGGVYSMATFDTSGSETEGGTANESDQHEKTSTTISKDVDYASYFAEYTFSQGSTIGIEVIPGEAELGTRSRTEAASADDSDDGTPTAKAEVSDHITLYVEPTWMMSETFGVYVKGGVSKVDIKTKESLPSASTYGDVTVYGQMTGFGAKTYLGNWFAKLEYVETDYGDISITSTTGNRNTVQALPDQEATRIALGYNF